jgi:S1-C subfamily serine protease
VDKNTIITASHWVNDKESIYEITDKFWNIYIWTLISKNLENDTALLKINDNFKYFTKFKYTKNLKIGEKVKSISFAFESQTVKNWVIKNIEWEKIYSDTLFEEWDSGSPLLNEKNEVIGINTEVDLNSWMWITRKLAISKK